MRARNCSACAAAGPRTIPPIARSESTPVSSGNPSPRVTRSPSVRGGQDRLSSRVGGVPSSVPSAATSTSPPSNQTATGSFSVIWI